MVEIASPLLHLRPKNRTKGAAIPAGLAGWGSRWDLAGQWVKTLPASPICWSFPLSSPLRLRYRRAILDIYTCRKLLSNS